MSKKSVHTRAVKRNARAKAKRTSIARGKATPAALQQKKMNKLFDVIGDRPDFDNVLEHAMKQVRKGKVEKSSFKDSSELLDGLKKMTGEVFRMYCYITLVNEMINKQVIVDEIKVDLPGITRKLLEIDNRIGQLVYLTENRTEMEDKFGEGSDLYINTESLDMGTTLQTFADILYEEVARFEPHSLVFEETLSRLADGEAEGDENQRRFKVLQTIAYAYMADISLKDKEAEEQTASELQEDNTGGNNEPVVA
ncbi:hypothetical protein OBP_092 [Pseudomonas phage OBP]|uniref:hypothetical protein n=1 Tax=Pseudomonas phage OBP TaxID=1124849 RepID=UPI000240D43A|nr:hypothetical protein OBP_092 [Pseudomonas phage OBP]AEV89529.1 hypothetical protein OBP_092 [Pseudomonas phage OBP]